MDVKTKAIGTVSAKDGYRIVLNGRYAAGLAGLDGFSHIVVLWYADRMPDGHDGPFVLDKPYENGPDRMGIFATRSPFRPNGICCTAAKVLDVSADRGTVEVEWIDAADGTPVLDIKPYHPSEDRVRDASVPPWCSHWPQCWEESADFPWEDEFPR